MKTYNNACFTHMCGNCPCKNTDAIKVGIGTELRTPKKGDRKRWRDFIILLYRWNNYFKSFIDENNLLIKFNINSKTLLGRSTYTNYAEHISSVKKKDWRKWTGNKYK